MQTCSVIIPAAGTSQRMGTKVKKQYLELNTAPVLAYTLSTFQKLAPVTEILVGTAPEDLPQVEEMIQTYQITKAKAVIGGQTRQATVSACLAEIREETTLVLVHDGVRPFVQPDKIEAIIQAAQTHGNAVLGIPAKDTIRQSLPDGTTQTLDRASLWQIHTPQGFAKELLIKANEQAKLTGYEGTDEASLVEQLGIPIQLIPDDATNIKLTTPEDLAYGTFLLKHLTITTPESPSSTLEAKDIVIYTDGACSGNPGPGGYGVVFLYNGKRKELSKGYADTTNNRMELTAIIHALQALKHPSQVTLYSDSKYVIDSITKKWVYNWKNKGWKKSDGNPALNVDLWEELLPELERHQVTFQWVKGHANNVENERCDALARAAAESVQ